MPQARAAVRHCSDTRFYVDGLGVATTHDNLDLDEIKTQLRSIDPDIFSDDLLSSPALQADLFGVKTLAYRRIINYFQADASCTMVFDTVGRRLADAKAAGAGAFGQIDTHIGLRPTDVESAEDKDLGNACSCHSGPSQGFVFYEA